MATRDRLGLIPLFYAQTDDRLLIASQETAFSSLGWTMIPQIASIYQESWIYSGTTFYTGIYKVTVLYLLN